MEQCLPWGNVEICCIESMCVNVDVPRIISGNAEMWHKGTEEHSVLCWCTALPGKAATCSEASWSSLRTYLVRVWAVGGFTYMLGNTVCVAVPRWKPESAVWQMWKGKKWDTEGGHGGPRQLRDCGCAPFVCPPEGWHRHHGACCPAGVAWTCLVADRRDAWGAEESPSGPLVAVWLMSLSNFHLLPGPFSTHVSVVLLSSSLLFQYVTLIHTKTVCERNVRDFNLRHTRGDVQ